MEYKKENNDEYYNKRMNQDDEINMRKKTNFIDRSIFSGDNREGITQSFTRGVGEITGDDMVVNDIDKGMPLRGNNCGKKINDGSRNERNKRLDFSVFDDDTGSPTNFSYYDKTDTHFSDFSEPLNMKINKLSIELSNMLNNNCLSPIGLYMTFGSLYCASGNTEIGEFLNLSEQAKTLQELMEMKKVFDKLKQNQICISNYLIVNGALNPNKKFYDCVGKIITPIVTSKQNYVHEHRSFNNFLTKMSKNMVYPVSETVFKNASVSSLNICYIRPTWDTLFNRIAYGKTASGLKIKYMISNNTKYNYYNDGKYKAIEIPTGLMNFGIIQSSAKLTPDRFNSMIMNFRLTCLSEVKIPEFVDTIKIRLSGVLYQNGLSGLFSELILKDCVDDQAILSDVVQNITVIINSGRLGSAHGEEKGKDNFIVDRSFIYYFRLVHSNTLLLIGRR